MMQPLNPQDEMTKRKKIMEALMMSTRPNPQTVMGLGRNFSDMAAPMSVTNPSPVGGLMRPQKARR
jgi:hypothetical protein